MILLMKGDEEYREIFNSLMLDLVEELDPTWRESGQVEHTPSLNYQSQIPFLPYPPPPSFYLCDK